MFARVLKEWRLLVVGNTGDEFLASRAGRFASIAKEYLEGALVLDAAQLESGKVLFRPCLALAAHGLEQVLKACTFLNGEAPPTSGPEGHNILGMWNKDVCGPVRRQVQANALQVAAEDRATGKYTNVPEPDEIASLIEEYVTSLAKLHAKNWLRYEAPKDTMAPRTPLLVKTLWRTSDDLVKRPCQFMAP